jgi:hypothetical protein
VLSTIEAVANLILSVTLVLCFKKVVYVAIGSLIPSIIIGWFYLWPWAAKDAGVKGWELARQVLYRNLRAGLPLAVFAGACRWIPILDFQKNTIIFLVEGALACVVAGLSLWHWGLASNEREKVAGKIAQKFLKKTAA